MGYLSGGSKSLTINNSYAHPQAIDSKYKNFYPFVYTSDSPTLSISNSFYKFPDGFENLVTTGTNQGTNKKATGTATAIRENLNTSATKVTINNEQVNPWIAHNDTVYLRTFAKYVDIKDFSYGQTPTITVVGNNGNGTVTYKYKVKGAADDTYATYEPGTTVLGVGSYTLKASVAAANGWNGWESTMDFEINALPYYDSYTDKIILHNLPLRETVTNVTLMGKGTQAQPFEIGTPDQWDAFATLVNLSYHNTYTAYYAKITADITFTGNHQQPGENGDYSFPHKNLGLKKFYGTIDGQGHTITLNQQETGGDGGNKATWGGLIWHTNNATINNLKVVGVIRTSNINCGAFIQNPNEGSVTLNNCQSSVKIISSSATSYHGGFLGNQHQNVTTIIRNCLFDGKYDPCSNAGNDTRCSGFIGNRQATTNIYNSYSNPISIDNTYKYYHTFTQETTSGQLNLDGHSYNLLPSFSGTIIKQGVDASKMTPDAIVEGLNTGATLVNSQNPWIVHNDTIYLRTFAKYVDIQGWTYGSPNAPTIVGNSGDGEVTYKYKVRGAADGTYATYTPGTTVLGVGSYTLKACVAAANGWNAWESTMDFTVSQKEATISWTNTALTYNGTAQTPTATVSNIVGEDECTVTVSVEGEHTNASTTAYTATAAALSNANYKLPTTLPTTTFTISQKEVTISWDNTELTYNGTAQKPTASVSNIVTGDACTVTVTVEGEHTNASTTAYTATATALSNVNYKLPTTLPTHTFTISQKEVTISWNNTELTYNGTAQKPTASVSNIVTGDACTVTVSGEQTNASSSAYTATATELSNANYKLPTTPTQTFTIGKAALTITADAKSKTYGDTDPAFTYTSSGLVGTDAITGALTRAAGEDVNSYAIIQGTLTAGGNYSITYTGANLTITQKEVGITWGQTLLTYNNMTQAPEATASGLVGTDVCNVTVSGAAKEVGSYTATATGLSNANYKLPTTGLSTPFQIVDQLVISFAADQQWSTWYGLNNYQVPAGMTAYKVTAIGEDKVTVDAINYIPANTGVLLYRTETDAAMVTGNAYTGATSSITSLLKNGSPTPYKDYILHSNQFVLSTVSTIGANRCYLPGSSAAGARGGLLIDTTGGGTTDLFFDTTDASENDSWFDLQGRGIEKPQKKGLYIRNGKKVVVK